MKKIFIFFLLFANYFSFAQTTPTFNNVVKASKLLFNSSPAPYDTIIITHLGVWKFTTVSDLISNNPTLWQLGTGSDSTAATYTAGNVGIGTTTPSKLLDVNGQSIFRNDIEMKRYH